MNIQLYGSKKNFDSKNAQRYFKERNIKIQFIEIHEFGMSKKVFEQAKKQIPLTDLIDKKSKAYKTLFMEYVDEKKWEEMLLENPSLFQTPIVRNENKFTLGYCPDIWKTWT